MDIGTSSSSSSSSSSSTENSDLNVILDERLQVQKSLSQARGPTYAAE